MSHLLKFLKKPFQTLGQNSRFVRQIRDLGLFAPWIVTRSGFSKAEQVRWQDYRNFKKKYGVLLSSPATKSRGEKVLFVHLLSISFLAFIQGFLAKSLDFHGAQPVFVVHRLNLWSETYLRLFGLKHFIYLEDYLPDEKPFEAEADRMLAGCHNVWDILALRFRNADVGRHLLSTALVSKRAPFVDFHDTAMMRLVRNALIMSMRSVIAAEKILQAVHPQKIFIFEGGYSPSAEFYDIALQRNIDTIRWFQSHQEDSVLFRRYRYEDRYEHYFTLANETWSSIKQIPWTPEQGEAVKESLKSSYLSGLWFKRKNMMSGKELKTPDQIRKELKLDPGKPNAFIFSHILWDATFWYGRNLFQDYGTWLIETIRAACNNPNVNWIIKMHPDNVWKEKEYNANNYDLQKLDEYRMIRKNFPELPPHVSIMHPENDTNPVSIFGFADYAVTVRGTVGIEFPCFGTPALTAGTGRYSGRGFTLDFDSPEEYLARLAHIQNIPPLSWEETALAQRFAYGVFNLRPLVFRTFSWKYAESRKFDAIANYDLSVNVSTLGDLKNAGDLTLFSNWVLNSDQRDFLMPTKDSVALSHCL